MRRRDLLAGLLVTTTASALRAAEPNKIYRLAAFVRDAFPFSVNPIYGPLFRRLRELGYVEGKNLIADQYVHDSRPERMAETARDMVRQKPDVITIFLNHEGIAQVAKETSTIPIVAMMGDPVAAGFVQNMARPEGNITGIALDAGIEMQGKHLDILRQVVPSASRIAYLSGRWDLEGAWGRAVIEAGRRSGVSIIGIPVDGWADELQYRQAFETMASQSVDALVFNGLTPNTWHRELLAELVWKSRLPSICWWPDLVQNAQLLLAYTCDLPNLGIDLWAAQVDQVFKGKKVADIPIPQPTKFILAINLKTAKALGLQIPPTLIAQADEVIE